LLAPPPLHIGMPFPLSFVVVLLTFLTDVAFEIFRDLSHKNASINHDHCHTKRS